MKNMKKFLSILLVLLMLSSMLPAAFAEETDDAAAEDSAPAVEIIVMEAPEQAVEAAGSESADAESPAPVVDTAENNTAEESPAPTEESAANGEAVDAQSAESGEAPATGETYEAQPAETGEASEAADSEEAEADPAAQSESEPAAAETEAAVPGAEEETQNAAAEAGTNYASRKKGEFSGKTITIRSWDIQDMPANPDYTYLTFTFKSDDDSTVYEGCIAGISINYTDDTRKYSDIIADLLTKVADSFYAGVSFSMSDGKEFSEENGLSVKPIDAEKVHPTATAEHPDTDDLLCWAASASDMLQFSGWSRVAVGETFASEDQVFDYLEKSFTDDGSQQQNAIKWFFNGVYPDQCVSTGTGEIIYGGTGNSQEKLTHGKNGNVLPDYAEECFEKYYTRETDGYDALYDAALSLKDGTAIGLTVNFYDKDGSGAAIGHALTVLGYIRNTLQTGWEALKALFISDSDDDSNTTRTREAALNSVKMNQLKIETVEGDTGAVQVLSMPDYSLTGEDTRITRYCTLAPYTAGAAKEQTGGKDAVHQIDFTVEYVNLGYGKPSNIKVGDSLQFCTSVKNSSYTTLDTSNEPYCKVTYTVRCNGEVVATPTFTYDVTGIYGSKMAANGGNYYETENAYTPTRAGNYTVSATVDGVYYKDANGNEIQIPEAYTSNNSSRLPYSFTVTDGDTPEPTPEPTPDQPDDDTATDEPANSISVPVWRATITGSADSETGIELKGVYGTGLTLMKNGKVVPAENYTLTFADNGSVIVTFTQDYIDTLLPGIHTFRVLDESGSLIGIIELTVR